MESTIKNQYPVIVTAKLQECKKFYQEIFNFDVAFEEDWYIQLVNNVGIELAFMAPNLDNQPNFLHNKFFGDGIILTLEVENAEEEYKRIKKLDLTVLLNYKEEPWGQKHFIIRDPANVILDIVEITTPDDYK